MKGYIETNYNGTKTKALQLLKQLLVHDNTLITPFGVLIVFLVVRFVHGLGLHKVVELPGTSEAGSIVDVRRQEIKDLKNNQAKMDVRVQVLEMEQARAIEMIKALERQNQKLANDFEVYKRTH